MKILTLVFFATLPLFSYAQDLPVYPALSAKTGAELFSMARITKFRVLVFPHWGVYSVPQGREESAKAVMITANEPCNAYLAVLDENQEWLKTGEILAKSTKINLTVNGLISKSGLPAPVYYECSSAFTVTRPAPLRSIDYPGDFVATTDGSNVKVISLTDADTYIKGVVPAEVEASWPAEVLKAQAIAARTYAWWSVVQARSQKSDFDMDDTVSFQAYLGNLKRTPATDLVTDQTEGQVMKYQGEVIKAYFSADSGGFTEDAFSAFGNDFPYCKAKPEQYDLAQTQTNWTKALSVASFQTQMAAAKVIPSGVGIRKVYVADNDTDSSGRVLRVSILGSNGKVYIISGNDFRYQTKVRSNLFKITFSTNGLVMDGKGYGHGVGMAQIGALQYSKQLNWNAGQILGFYYAGITIDHD